MSYSPQREKWQRHKATTEGQSLKCIKADFILDKQWEVCVWIRCIYIPLVWFNRPGVTTSSSSQSSSAVGAQWPCLGSVSHEVWRCCRKLCTYNKEPVSALKIFLQDCPEPSPQTSVDPLRHTDLLCWFSPAVNPAFWYQPCWKTHLILSNHTDGSL